MGQCDPELCHYCSYIGQGCFFCDCLMEIVVDEWEPTEDYMGEGCPHRRKRGNENETTHKKKRNGRR